jgi:salicylate hydroxylase
MPPKKLRVAISGSGVAGASLIFALLQHPHIDPHIFEAASTFRENAGQCFGLARNATAALELMSATACLERAGGVPMKGVRFLFGQGEEAGAVVFEQDNEAVNKATTTIVQRANIVRELLVGVPEERKHVSKKLERYEMKGDGSVLVHFRDGSTHECDVCVIICGVMAWLLMKFYRFWLVQMESTQLSGL